MGTIKLNWKEILKCDMEVEVNEEELRTLEDGDIPTRIYNLLKYNEVQEDECFSFEEAYSKEEKLEIEKYIKDTGAWALGGFEIGYEYKHGQMLEAARAGVDPFDYDRWQNLQKLCKHEIEMGLFERLENVFYNSGIESLELKGVEE